MAECDMICKWSLQKCANRPKQAAAYCVWISLCIISAVDIIRVHKSTIVHCYLCLHCFHKTEQINALQLFTTLVLIHIQLTKCTWHSYIIIMEMHNNGYLLHAWSGTRIGIYWFNWIFCWYHLVKGSQKICCIWHYSIHISETTTRENIQM